MAEVFYGSWIRRLYLLGKEEVTLNRRLSGVIQWLSWDSQITGNYTVPLVVLAGSDLAAQHVMRSQSRYFHTV